MVENGVRRTENGGPGETVPASAAQPHATRRRRYRRSQSPVSRRAVIRIDENALIRKT